MRIVAINHLGKGYQFSLQIEQMQLPKKHYFEIANQSVA